MTPRALILLGSAVCALAVAFAAVGATLRGPLNPECSFCAPLAARALLFLALPTGVLGAVLVAIGLVRREPAEEPGAGR